MSTPSSKLLFAFVCAGFFTVVMMISLPAFAQITKSQRAMEVEAKKACLAGKSYYEKGIEVLAQLFAETNEPTYIYNQGRCFQQNRQPEQALDRFQEYLRREPKMTPKEKATLEIYMRESEVLIAKMQTPIASPPPPQVKVEIPPEPAPTQILADPNLEPTPRPGRGLRIAGVTTITLGLVTLGGAVILNWMHLEKENSFKKSGQVNYSSAEKTASNRYKLASLIGYGVGAVAVATGITLYIIGNRTDSEGPSVALIPAVMPNQMTLNLRGVF